MSCSEAEELISSPGFLAAVTSQAVAGFLSIVVSAVVAKQSKKLYFHINCKILIRAMLLFYIVHSVFMVPLQAVHLIRYVVISDPCQVGLPSSLCIYLRAPTNVCIMSFSLFQLMSLLERLLALWKHRNYSFYGPTFGYFSVGICIFVPIGVLFWQLENANFQEKLIYCSVATVHTRERTGEVCFAMCGINMVTLLGLIAIFVFNNVARKRSKFDLRSSYQTRENADVLRIMLPLSIFETICHAIFSFTGGFISMYQNDMSAVEYRTGMTASYIVPYYILISPMILFYVIRRAEKMRLAKLKQMTNRKDENDVYTQMYKKMWSQAVPKS